MDEKDGFDNSESEEQEFDSEKDVIYVIYRLDEKYRTLAGVKEKNLLTTNNVIDMRMYKRLYSSKIDMRCFEKPFSSMQRRNAEILKRLTMIFNMLPPEDYPTETLGINDVVKIGHIFYCCRARGWKRITAVNVEQAGEEVKRIRNIAYYQIKKK